MHQFRHCQRVFALLLATVISTGTAFAAKPSEDLLPASTKAYIAIDSLEKLGTAWDKTQLGQMMREPSMQPFVEDLKRQLKSKFSQSGVRLGVSWEDLDGVATGEIAVASVQPAGDKLRCGTVLLADITGQSEKAKELLDKVGKNLVQKGAIEGTVEIGGVSLAAFKLAKKKPTDRSITAYYGIHQDILIAVDDADTATEVIRHFEGQHTTTLRSVPAYQISMERSRQGFQSDPNIRWFIEPFGYVEVGRAYAGGRKKRGTDMLKVLATQGFDAIQGLGGQIALATPDHELHHQSFIYAPPVTRESGDASTDRYRHAARMLDFPNSESLFPQTWVPKKLSLFMTFNWKMQNAFWHSESLVNEIAGDEVFKDVIKSIETDPNGPRINVEREFVQFLGERATVISDYREPIDTKSERVLMAIQVKDPQSVMAAVNKAMKSDGAAKMITVDGHTIWEMTQEEVFAIEEIKIDGADLGAGQDEQEPEEDEKRFRPNAAVTVAHGHLLIATRVDYLVDLLKEPAEGDRLADATDYQRTMAAIKQLGANSDSFRLFSRTDQAYRVTYEMMRQNKMPESESMFAKFLNGVFAPEEEDVLRDPQLDGTKLPEFSAVEQYFGPAGMFFRTEDVGWSITGCVLKK